MTVVLLSFKLMVWEQGYIINGDSLLQGKRAMKLQRSNFLLFSAGLTGIFLLAFVVQHAFLISWDVSWDLMVTKRLLQGGTYSQDFFDINPPLIFYLYIPVIKINQWLSLSEYNSLLIYVFSLIMVALGLSYPLIKQILVVKRQVMIYFFLLAIALILFCIPLVNLAQREHLLTILTLPYFLLLVARLQNDKVSPYFAMVIGFVAGVGFAIKPFYLCAFALTELYYVYHKKNILSVVRPEVAVIVIFQLVYLVAIALFYPDYIHLVVPMAREFYYLGYRDHWLDVLTQPYLLYCLFIYIIYAINYKNVRLKNFKAILFLASLGFLCAYFLQGTRWVYHLLPTLSLCTVLSILLCIDYAFLFKKNYFIMALLVSFFYLPLLFLLKINYSALTYYNYTHQKIINYLGSLGKDKEVLFISASPHQHFPSVSLAKNVHYASRFMHLFWIPGLVKSANHPSLSGAERKLIAMVLEDFIVYKPDYVFMDVSDHKPFMQKYAFDFYAYFNKSPDFQAIWDSYQYVTTLDAYDVRKNTKHAVNWQLYLQKNLDLQALSEGPCIILTGEGLQRVAYYSKDRDLLFTKNQFLSTTTLRLTQKEVEFLQKQKQGVLDKKNPMVHNLLAKLETYPIYKYDVYKRIQ